MHILSTPGWNHSRPGKEGNLCQLREMMFVKVTSIVHVRIWVVYWARYLQDVSFESFCSQGAHIKNADQVRHTSDLLFAAHPPSDRLYQVR